MSCERCGHDNRADARFCRGCGAPLAMRCRDCEAELLPGSLFCDACGAPVGNRPASPAPPAREARASPLSYTPEHLADKILASTVNQYAGDRIMALFGAPISHEGRPDTLVE